MSLADLSLSGESMGDALRQEMLPRCEMTIEVMGEKLGKSHHRGGSQWHIKKRNKCGMHSNFE